MADEGALETEFENRPEESGTEEPEEEENDPVAAAPVTTVQPATQEIDLNKVIQLGDRVIIDSTAHGFVVGTVYYRSGELIRVKPDGASNQLIDFQRLYDGRRDEFDPLLEVKAAYILTKRLFPDFIRQQMFEVGQTITAISELNRMTKYTLTKMNKDEDSIVLTDTTGSEFEIKFSHVGIDPETDIKILKITGAPKPIQLADVAEEEEAEGEAEGEEEEDEEEGEEAEEVMPPSGFRVTILGTVQLPKIKAYKEEASSKLLIPQNIQKSDALNDMIGMLDPDLQRDEQAQREIRIMVETMFHMKNAIINYNEDGTFKSVKEISPTSLIDLMRLSKNDIPLGRAVLSVSKRLFIDPELNGQEEEEEGDAVALPPEGITMVNELSEWDRMDTGPPAFAASVVHTADGQANIIAHYDKEQRFYGSYERPWTPLSETVPVIENKSDTTFFRLDLPQPPVVKKKATDKKEKEEKVEVEEEEEDGEGVEDAENDYTLNGYLKSKPRPSPREPRPHPALGKLPFGQERALTTTFRKGAKAQKQILMPAEEASILYYLLFPESVGRTLGTTRSGQLSLDSARGKAPLQIMSQILTRLGGIKEDPTPQTIVALGVEGSTLGNIPLVEYFKGMNIPGMGIGDTLTTLEDFGLAKFEFTPVFLEMLVSKLRTYQNQLKATLQELGVAALVLPAEATPNPMIPLDSPILSSLPLDDAILATEAAHFRSRNPTLQKSDIALVADFLRTHADYYQAIIGGQQLLIAEADLSERQSIRLTKIEMERRLKERRTEVGDVPHPNLCEHVGNLRTIRKIENEQEKYYYLTKFFAKYQGGRKDDNWIDCTICKKNLLCVHERLLLQAYLNPLDKPALLKQLNLNFSGGVFQGHYICRACGQPIQPIGYDTNLQFDDEGRPMSGRAELVDQDALTDREIEIALGVAFAPVEEIPFTGDQLVYYKIVRLLAERIGIYMEQNRYRMVIERLQGYLNSLPSREEHREAQEKAREAAAAEGRPYKPGNYDAVINRNTVGAAAMYLLIEIQTHIPNYESKFTLPGCVAGFGGFPLTGSLEADEEGIVYMACNISTIANDEAPWNKTGYQAVRDREKRQTAIVRQLKTILKQIISDNAIIQREIVKKNLYLLGLQGKKEGEELAQTEDSVPVGFLPDMVVPVGVDAANDEEGAFNAAAAAAAAAAANNQRGVARAWIRQGHLLAKTTANVIRGSLFSEITCCKVNITTPGQFWDSKGDMPKLPDRQITPLLRARSQQVHFEPRREEGGVVEVDADKTYVLFLKFCFTGDRIGYPHEPGLTNLCPHCGFQFPGHPSVVDPGEGARAIKAVPELDTSLEGCQTLLDKVHNHNLVDLYVLPGIEPFSEILISFAGIEPPPFAGWNNLFSSTMRALQALGNGSLNRGEMVEALGPLSNRVAELEDEVKGRIHPKVSSKMDLLTGFPWQRFVQIIETYFVVPIQKIVSDFNIGQQSKFTVPKDFSREHKALLEKVVNNENELIKRFQRKHPSNFTLSKLQQYLKQMSAILMFKDKLRMELFPGRMESFQYIQQALLFGPLSELFDSNILPPGVVEIAADIARRRMGIGAVPANENDDNPIAVSTMAAAAAEGTSAISAALSTAAAAAGTNGTAQLVSFINETFMKLFAERLAFDDEQLRQIIQDRNEKELRRILDRKTAMSDEERAVDGMLQSRGMGDWAVIRADLYSSDQFDRERQQNEEAGIDEELYGLNFGEIGEGDGDNGEGGYDHGEDNNDDD
jgi:hypothetical protein